MMLAAVALLIILAQATGPTTQGLGGYRFGMTKAAVGAVSDCKPYVPVRTTDGLECPNFEFDGRRMNISFIFGPAGLRRIQLWWYEGTERSQALATIGALNAYLTKHYGGVRHIDLPADVPMTPDVLLSAAVDAAAASPLRQAQLRWTSLEPPPERQLYASVGVGAGAYMVFLFHSVPPEPR